MSPDGLGHLGYSLTQLAAESFLDARQLSQPLSLGLGMLLLLVIPLVPVALQPHMFFLTGWAPPGGVVSVGNVHLAVHLLAGALNKPSTERAEGSSIEMFVGSFIYHAFLRECSPTYLFSLREISHNFHKNSYSMLLIALYQEPRHFPLVIWAAPRGCLPWAHQRFMGFRTCPH